MTLFPFTFTSNHYRLGNKLYVQVMRAIWLLLLTACQPQNTVFNNTDITGSALQANFVLSDMFGKTTRLSDFKNKVVVVFFGYTQCPDVCPTTLQNLAGVMQALGPDAKKVQVLFVTIDPARDTPALLKAYVPQFYPGFMGLTGTSEQIAAAAKGLRVFYQKVSGNGLGNDQFDHTAGSYVFDPKGQLRLLIKHGQTIDQIVPDLQALLKGA